jgi:deoxyribodipyrimidine photo-lyase
MIHSPTVVWFRLDLRVADNPALDAAVKRGGPIVPVFVWDPESEKPWEPGGASNWWLHRSLESLAQSLEQRGARLLIHRGNSAERLLETVRAVGAGAVFWNRRYEPAVRARDARIKETLKAQGIDAESFNGALLNEPWTIANQQGRPFQVFTPYWRHCLQKTDPGPALAAPRSLRSSSESGPSVSLKSLGLEPRISWDSGFRSLWTPGEVGAGQLLERFGGPPFDCYKEHRDRPDLHGTSRLSPHLHFGEITPRQIWHALRARMEPSRNPAWKTSQYITEIGWREFSHHLLYHFPHTPLEPLRPAWNAFPWRSNPTHLRAWQRGLTGYPIVDAGMRELWGTGWMHNRVRMIAASFLVKDLVLSWQEGAKWFWDTLVDADLAQNTMGWQWSAGSGADAAPYFRIFNPVSQGEKFDPEGHYVRRWVPELAKLPNSVIHQPWTAPSSVLRGAGVTLGIQYPHPIVDHAKARLQALEAYASLKTAAEKTADEG